MKRLLAAGDLHAGHVAGFCPPEYWSDTCPELRALEEECYTWQKRKVEALKPIDTLLLNGDSIEGKGHRSGGRELYTTDRIVQADVAWQFVEMVNPRALIVTKGTPSHVGDDECFEDLFARRAEAAGIKYAAGDYVQFAMEDTLVAFGAKHKVGSSAVPHGRSTAINRAVLWQQIWEDAGRREPEDVVLRSHVHYYRYSGDADRLGMVLPALQAARTEFGARQCDGLVDYGFVTFDVEGDAYSWRAHLLRPAAEQVQTLVV